MAALERYDYIFALTTLFAALDAWNIGGWFAFHFTSYWIFYKPLEPALNPQQVPTM